PATFRVSSKIKNADLCVWELGSDRPLEVSLDAAKSPERLVTFNEPGTHTIRLAVFDGKQTIERSEKVNVMPPPSSRVSASVRVKHDLVTTKVSTPQSLVFEYPANYKEATYKFRQTLAAEPGFMVTQAQFVDKPAADLVKSPSLQISADRLKVTVSGE